MATNFTLAEAKQYLETTLKNWELSGTPEKVIRLAKWAEKWTPSKDNEAKEKMKMLFTSIRGITIQIDRDKKLGANTEAEERKLLDYTSQLQKLESIHGKYIPPKPKKKAKTT